MPTEAARPGETPPRRLRGWRRPLVAAALAFTALVAAEHALGWLWPFPLDRLEHWPASVAVQSADGELLRLVPNTEGERLLPTSADRVSPRLIDALVASEDRKFWRHDGVDWPAVVRSALLNLRAGRVVSGASTLTMQLVRIAEPRPRRLVSKLVEAFRARQLERLWDKRRILDAYLTLVPIGGELRGFEAASLRWFGKPASDLSLAEAATLVAMLPAPTRRAPDHGAAELRRARDEVLDRVLLAGFATEAEVATARTVPLPRARHDFGFAAPHAVDWHLARLRGAPAGGVLATGIQAPLQRRLEDLAARWRGPRVDGLAVLVLDRGDGAVRAMVGSRDWHRSKLNACLCARSVGSTLKPFLWAQARGLGALPRGAALRDEPLRFADWVPANSQGDHAGAIAPDEALRESRNLPAIVLLQRVGADRFRRLLVDLGLPVGREHRHLDLALGSLGASPLDLARAWRRFGGDTLPPGLDPAARDEVLDVLSATSPDPAVVPPGRVAWKTGTSSNRRDAWTVALHARAVVVVWLGNLDGRGAPGLVGADTAARLLAEVVAVLDGHAAGFAALPRRD